MLDKRRHARFACDLDAEIETSGGPIAARALDVSRGGLCLSCASAIATATDVAVKLTLVFGDDAYSEPLALPARVVWCTKLADEHQLGCMFRNLSTEQAQYLDMFLRFLRGEVLTQDASDDDELSDPDAAPFTESAKRSR